MASGANAFPSRGGFNQSGGAHFICLAPLDRTTTSASVATDSFVHALVNPGTNSGGAFAAPTLSTVTISSIIGPGVTSLANYQQFVSTGRLLKDMGKTVVSAGRTFRKFAPVVAGLGVSSFGVAGGPAAGANSGYGAFYLEVGREGLTGTPAGLGPAPIARYF